VGQNVQAKAADKRSEQTYNDAEAILHECLQLQAHLQVQDAILQSLILTQQASLLKPKSPPRPRSAKVE
jgi:hypothetical protein